jgi:23S rRNA-/tRNA-specific pseudouridylate synthase
MSKSIINENSKKRSRFPILDILYEDSELIIVEKPYGMLSVPGKTTKDEKKLPRYLEWGISIRRAADEISKIPINELEIDIYCVEILNKMLTYNTIPRKEKQFHTYLQRLLKIQDETIRNQIWEYLTIVDNRLHKRDIDLIPLHLVSVFEIVENMLGHRIYTCHRLDMETSGVIMFAKNVNSCALINKMFETRQVSKSYIAKVAHRVDQEQVATISIPMRPDPNSRIVQVNNIFLFIYF